MAKVKAKMTKVKTTKVKTKLVPVCWMGQKWKVRQK